MMYSVWNPAQHLYIYYDAPGRLDEVPTPKHLIGAKGLGVAATQAAWSLPPGARWVGQGPDARGCIATTGQRALGDFSGSTNWLVIGGLALAGYVLYKSMAEKPRKRRRIELYSGPEDRREVWI